MNDDKPERNEAAPRENSNDDWSDLDKKHDAILRVLRYVIDHQAEGDDAVKNDKKAHGLFEDPQIGNIKIPNGARVIIFDKGEQTLGPAGSIVLELPPKSANAYTDEELSAFVLGNYAYWAPTP